MRGKRILIVAALGVVSAAGVIVAQGGGQGQGRGGQAQPAGPDPVQILVDRLDLEKYKATIKGLTQFGDRREGTQRNRDAVTWIEAQLKSYGCATQRIEYERTTGGGNAGAGNAAAGNANRGGGGGAAGAGAGAGGATGAGAAGAGAGAGQAAQRPPATVLTEPNRRGTGGSTYYGITRPTGVNNDPMKQPDEKLRALDMGPVIPGPIPEVFCTKVGATRPNEIYILGGHMDGIGYGEAANDDGSGTALVMELARIFSMPDVTTDVSIRFALWNGEEGGLNGAKAYVAQRQALQGKEDPPGSGKYPEPKWLGMIQHDMMMWDHGMPRADGSLSPDQRPEADFNIEFKIDSEKSADSMKLAWTVKAAADKYSKNYPGMVGPHMTNTDSDPFKDIVAAISLRENERGMMTGAGWNPHWHQPTDLYKTFSDKDFLLGLNSAQATLAAVAGLAGAKVTVGR